MKLTTEEEKKLTEWLGECWREHCGKENCYSDICGVDDYHLDFSDWRVVGRCYLKLTYEQKIEAAKALARGESEFYRHILESCC